MKPIPGQKESPQRQLSAAAAGNMQRGTVKTVFVPDEEAAGVLEPWLGATAPVGTVGVWPGWPETEPVFGLHLPHGGGVCLRGFPEAVGEKVAGRAGTPHAGLVHLDAAQAEALGLPAVPDDGAGPRLAELDGVAVVVSSGRVARALLWEAAFAPWWRGKVPRSVRAAAAAWTPQLADPEGMALATVEGRLLAGVDRLAEPEAERTARTLALLRRERRGEWTAEREEAERGLELLTGVTCYVGWRCAGDVPALADHLGQLSDPARARIVGALLCHVLDRLAGTAPPPTARGARRQPPADWREELTAGRATDLDTLLEAYVRFEGGSRDDSLLSAACDRFGYDAVLADARQRAERAAQARAALVDRILRGQGTLLTFATGALGSATITPAEPPQPVNGGLTLYAAGARFEYPDGTFLDSTGVPAAEDRHGGLVHVRVAARLQLGGDGQILAQDAEVEFNGGLDLRVGAVRARARRGSVRPIEGGWLVRLAPA